MPLANSKLANPKLANSKLTKNETQDCQSEIESLLISSASTKLNTNLESSLDNDLKAILQNENAVNHFISDRNNLANCLINRCLVALGSNFKAEKHLAMARDKIESLTKCHYWSTPFINPDYTATATHPKPDYTNQCGYLTLERPQLLQQFIETSKHIEKGCARQVLHRLDDSISDKDDLKRGRVSIDIDVLSVFIAGQWHIIKQRYPFKAHEVIGLKELLKG